MAIDGLFLYSLAQELQACVGGRINKIHQPAERDLILQIRAQGRNMKLLISANPTYPRIHLTEKTYQNPAEAPMFCMLMRKHLENGIIERIEQPDLERVLHLHVRHRDELGDLTQKLIIIELMGRHSNTILVDTKSNTIIDSIHHVTPALSSYRIVLPGQAYIEPPKQDKHHTLQSSRKDMQEAVIQLIHQHPHEDDMPIWKWILEQWKGFSPLSAKELVARAGLTVSFTLNQLSIRQADALAEAFESMLRPILIQDIQPNLSLDSEQDKWSFYVLPLQQFTGEQTHYETISELLEAYYGDKAEEDAIKQKTGNLKKWLQNERTKNEKKIKKLQKTLQEADQAEQFRIYGELLTASLHAVKRGASSISVINYYDEEQAFIEIPLDPTLSPSDNAQRYFKKYNKAKNSVKVVEEQLQQTREEITYMDNLIHQLDHAQLSDVIEIREELVEQGYLRERSRNRDKGRKKKGKSVPQLLCYTSSEQIPIYVGKNNTQNDYVTNRIARSQDTWLHTKDIPGSHVVIRSTEYGEATLQEAAMLAAYYSQARFSSQVPVDYTAIKHVRKPTGAKPGFVIYDHQKTIYVTPSEERVQSLPCEIK
ncbi:Rqc2 family fibronectin-binding protein [Marinicrinis sediminis]|uniref:Rqc2 homolog RqcH n=1 Tax=Marinicrinis sediminis TaxID=1652465 RepID=A0ABW5R626_9BACL